MQTYPYQPLRLLEFSVSIIAHLYMWAVENVSVLLSSHLYSLLIAQNFYKI